MRGLIFVLLVAGCGAKGNPPGVSGTDAAVVAADLAMTMGGDPDLAAPVPDGASGGDDGSVAAPDLTMMMNPNNCQPDPKTDGQQCNKGCPIGSGTIPVTDALSGECRCWFTCTPGMNTCPCGRRCAELVFQTDMGVKPTGTAACLPSNGPGERCGRDANNKAWQFGACAENTYCVNEDDKGVYAYCMWRCTKQAECPKGTTCVPLQQGGNVCAIDNTEMNGKAVGAMCSNMALCGVPLACDGTCRQQCNGPWDQTTCKAPQKCQSLHDLAANKTWAWVCK